MKFIVDAHFPKSICTYFIEQGHEAVHTSELPLGNDTEDNEILVIAVRDQATVISKDSDFYHSFLLYRKPPKLVVVKVGNMRLKEIRTLFKTQTVNIIEALSGHDLLELYPDKIIGIDQII